MSLAHTVQGKVQSIMMVAESATPAAIEGPLWLLIVVGACVPVTVVALWRIGRWWVSGAPIPLPLDKAWPAVPWPPAFGLAVFVFMSISMILIAEGYAQARQRGFWPWEPLPVPEMFGVGVFLGQAVPPLLGLAAIRLFQRGAAATVGVRLGTLGPGLLAGIVAVAAVLPLCVVALKVNTVLVNLVGAKPTEHPLLVTVHEARVAWVAVVGLFQAGVMAPLAEEFMYRGVLMTTLLKVTGIGWALVISSAIFALVHVSTEPQAALPLFVLALAMGYVAYRTRSLVGPIVAHSLFNSLMLLGSFTGR
jgi:membrane protease YdiL (CAAX protease family)